MRVALYTGTYHRNQDGVARSLGNLSRSIHRRGFRLGVWSPSHSAEADPGVEKQLVPSIPLPLYPAYRIGFPWRIAAQLDRFRPDVVHVATPDLVGSSFLFYARRRRLAAVASYHTDFGSYLKYFRLGAFEPWLWLYFKWLYGRFQRTFVPNETVARQLQARGLRKLSIWPRGIDGESFHPGFRSQSWRIARGLDDKTVILFCGRLVGYKDLEVFADIHHRLRRTHQEQVAFLLVGEGPLKNQLQEAMPDAVFTDRLEDRELSIAYASSDIFLFPSTTETFGNVVLEAIASGLPAVVSDRGGCQEIVRRAGAGLVCRAGGSFYRAVRLLLEDQAQSERYRRNGLAYARGQDWEEINQIVLDTYVEVAGPGGLPRRQDCL